jgi:hypothetical protein
MAEDIERLFIYNHLDDFFMIDFILSMLERVCLDSDERTRYVDEVEVEVVGGEEEGSRETKVLELRQFNRLFRIERMVMDDNITMGVN